MATVHIYVHDALPRWKGSFSGTLKSGKKVSFTAEVEARDPYEAGDRLKEMAKKKYGEEPYYPVVQFKLGSRLPAGSISQRIAKKAGAEEDE